jgi:hypothetical protein
LVLEPPVELGVPVAMELEQQEAEGWLTDGNGESIKISIVLQHSLARF